MKYSDDFLSKSRCDRCGNQLTARIMSWFTTETICMECSEKESEIKRKLREKGMGSREGCGYIPKVGE